MSKAKFYHCTVCGRVDYVAFDGAGNKKCCETPMVLLEANTVDAAAEKHVPIIERENNKLKVTVSSTLHPMLEEHFITFIAISYGDKLQYQALHPGGEPVAYFDVPEGEKVTAYEYCNLHGLWSSEEK